MGKTSQRKHAAFEKGNNDGYKGRGYQWKKRMFKADYDSGFQCGKADRLRERTLERMTPEEREAFHAEERRRHCELGPEPT